VTIAGQQQAGNVGAVARCMECLAFIAAARNAAEQAGNGYPGMRPGCWALPDALARVGSSPMVAEEQAEYDPIVGQLKSAPGFDTAWRQGAP